MKHRARWIAGDRDRCRGDCVRLCDTARDGLQRRRRGAARRNRREKHKARRRGRSSDVEAEGFRVSGRSRTRSPKHALPDGSTPLGEAVQTLREYAGAGDADAAIELSWRLSTCTEHALLGTEQNEKTMRDSIERDRTDESLTDELAPCARPTRSGRSTRTSSSARPVMHCLPTFAKTG